MMADKRPDPDEALNGPGRHALPSHAPLSTHDLLRRMGHDVDRWEEEEPDDPPAAQPSASFGQPAPQRPHPPAPPPDDEEEFSTEEYLQGLLARLNGPGSQRHNPSSHQPLDPTEPALAENQSPATPAEPRRSTPPPELGYDMSAMRELANLNAKHALTTHNRRHRISAARIKLILATAAIAASFALIELASRGTWWLLYAGLTALLLAAGWTFQYLWITQDFRTGPAGPAAADPPPAHQPAQPPSG